MLRTNEWPKLVRRLAPKLRCSFCRRSADEVERLVSGASAYICDACVAECVSVLDRHGGFGATGPAH
jgi:hypothetical protein